jgi:hypothetical protein
MDRLKRLTTSTVGILGAPSSWLNRNQKRIWKQIVTSAPGMLGENDRTLLEITYVLKERLEKHAANNAQLSQLVSCLNKLGMFRNQNQPIDSAEEANL